MLKFFFLFFYKYCEKFYHLPRIKFFLKKVLSKNKKLVIFDVGAHIGTFTKMLKTVYKKNLFYCFEPNKTSFNHLKNLQNDKTIVVNAGVGDKIGVKKIRITLIDLTSTLSKTNLHSTYYKIKKYIIKEKKNFHKIKIITLDKFCKMKKIKKIDFLKIDVEGYELKVLIGSKKIIKNTKFILIEFQNNKMYKNYSARKIELFLKKNNFKLIKIFKFPFMFFEDRLYKKIN